MADNGKNYERSDCVFGSCDASCVAWHYRPLEPALPSAAGSPCIVMAHGFGGTRDAGLEAFAECFADAGLHVLLFDYRHFGASEGEPRQLVSIGRQQADWHAAIAHARELEGVDGERIGLWGTSFSGGHVVAVAAADPEVAAISSQVPMLDGMATLRALIRNAGIGPVARVSLAGLRDQAAAMAGAGPVTLPIVGAPGELAAMSTPDALPGYTAITPPDWVNRFCARVMLGLANYRPIRAARRLRCPALFIGCTRDAITPPEPTRRAAQLAPDAELLELDMGHFDIYVGEGFARASSAQRDFFLKRLAPSD